MIFGIKEMAIGLVLMCLEALCLYYLGYFSGRADEIENQISRHREAWKSAIEGHGARAEAGHAVEKETLAAVIQQEKHTQQLARKVRRHDSEDRRQKTEDSQLPGASRPLTGQSPVLGPLSPDCRLDAGLLYLWRAANRGADLDPAGVSDDGAAGRAAATAGRSDAPGTDREPHRDGGDVPRPEDALFGTDPVAGRNP
jgi:hypothetical protein